MSVLCNAILFTILRVYQMCYKAVVGVAGGVINSRSGASNIYVIVASIYPHSTDGQIPDHCWFSLGRPSDDVRNCYFW